jgi:PRC-barrel domain protein
MFEAENIRDWRLQDVLDEDGKKLGKLEAVYVDTTSDKPVFASVVEGGGLRRRRLTFVPLNDAVVGPGWLKVRYPKRTVRGALQIGTDDELLAEQEPELFRHYGLDYDSGPEGVRRLARR